MSDDQGRRRAEAMPERWLVRATSTPVPCTPPRARVAVKTKVIVASERSRPSLSGLRCFARDSFCTMVLSSGSKNSTQSDSNSESDDEVCDELPFLRQEN
jgi:hypothetical protein